MNKELLQERKKMIYDFICDELYVPMKAKEMAIVLNVPKSQRGELMEVLDALVADGKVEISGRGKYVKSEGKYLTGVFTAHPLCDCGGRGRRYLHSGHTDKRSTSYGHGSDHAVQKQQWKAQRGNGDKDFIQRNRAACLHL